MLDQCPGCGHLFEREEGYWVGAIIVNTAATEALFAVLFIGTLILTIPNVPWQPLLAVALGTNGVFPWIFYPSSKTTWVAIDVHWHSPKK
jgi:hypothetical protein